VAAVVHSAVLIIFVMTLVLHCGRSVSTSRLKLNSGVFSGMHNSGKISW
jgi:hypothetical protein